MKGLRAITLLIAATALLTTTPAAFADQYEFVTKWGSEGTGDGQFKNPVDVEVDGQGNVYVTDPWNDRIQKFYSNGTFQTKWGSKGAGDGQFKYPTGVAVDTQGNVYVADFSNRIQKFGPNGVFQTKWGSEGTGIGQFDGPTGVAVDTQGNVYIADNDNDRIQKFNSNGVFQTKWGGWGNADGAFKYPVEVAVDTQGNVYVADYWNYRIQKFRPSSLPIQPTPTNQPISPIQPTPTNQPISPNQPMPPKPLDASVYKNACKLKLTSPKLKAKNKGLKASRKSARRLFTHGVKGEITWGQDIRGRDSVCSSVKMALLQKKGNHYYIPGTETRISSKDFTSSRLERVLSRLRKKKAGLLRSRQQYKGKSTKLSFKPFNRRSSLGRRALKSLSRSSYRGTYTLFYKATVEGTDLFRKVEVRAR